MIHVAPSLDPAPAPRAGYLLATGRRYRPVGEQLHDDVWAGRAGHADGRFPLRINLPK